MGLFYEDHGLGHLPDLFDYRDVVFSAPLVPGASLPLFVAPVDGDFPIYDQHQDNACTGFAVKEAAEIVLAQAGVHVALSASFLWWLGRLVLGWTSINAGCSIRDVIQAGNRFGFASESTAPYTPGTHIVPPPAEAWEQAADHKAFDYASVETTLAAKQALVLQKPVVFGTTLTESFDDASRNGGFFPSPAGRPIGAHAMTIVGYDDDVPFPTWGTKGGFRVRNHWRRTWGDGGRCWMPYVHFNSLAVSDAWVLRGIRK